MPDLLLEFLSEEIPARMQARAAEDLKKIVTDRLVNAGLTYEGARAFATPRRLALTVHGVPARQPDLKEERKGPKVGAPEQAIAGFVRAAGLQSINDAKVQPDKKGDFYVAVIERRGKPAIEVIAEFLPEVIGTFPWPKSMRWGAPHQIARGTQDGQVRATQSGEIRVITTWLSWVRPLHSILATFGPETEEPDIVPFEVDGLAAGDETRGHRFMAPGTFKVRRFDDYAAKLAAAKVVLDAGRRADVIATDAKNLAFAQGYELIEDDGLLAEVAGLVEWPVVLMGSFDAAFLSIPGEVIRATIRNNQKCFVLRDPQTAKLVNKFILVANEEAADGGKAITAGNERVIRARLSDAKFFYDTDLKTKLEDRLPKFAGIVFHEKLGTQAERIARIEALATEIAGVLARQPRFFDGEMLKADDLDQTQDYVRKVRRAARLCKADLLTGVVGEFPELQGLMGRYYAEAQGEDEAVAHACEDHYKPKGPDDLVPADPVSIAVALADKIDTLVGFWAVDEKPTGSKDPYALRRAALGIIRLILENNLRFNLLYFCTKALDPIADKIADAPLVASVPDISPANAKIIKEISEEVEAKASDIKSRRRLSLMLRLYSGPGNITAFFTDRLYQLLRDRGERHDLVSAAYGVTETIDLVLMVRRVEALGKFLDSDDGKNLLLGVKRATNIIRIEEKKEGRRPGFYSGAPNAKLYKLPEEKALAEAVAAAKKDAAAAVAREDFAAAMTAMAKLRPKVDAFFDKVTVNVDDANLRENRLKLLNEIRDATRAVADFSKIEA